MVIHRPASTSVKTEMTPATAKKMSGRQISTGERVFIAFSSVSNNATRNGNRQLPSIDNITANSDPFTVKERATIVCRRQGLILLVTRERSRWSLPGGTIRRTESPLEAARRELAEETTLDVEALSYLFQFGGLSKRHHVFLVDLPPDADPKAGNEIAHCHWFPPGRVASLITSVPTRGIIEPIIRHKNVTI